MDQCYLIKIIKKVRRSQTQYIAIKNPKSIALSSRLRLAQGKEFCIGLNISFCNEQSKDVNFLLYQTSTSRQAEVNF